MSSYNPTLGSKRRNHTRWLGILTALVLVEPLGMRGESATGGNGTSASAVKAPAAADPQTDTASTETTTVPRRKPRQITPSDPKAINDAVAQVLQQGKADREKRQAERRALLEKLASAKGAAEQTALQEQIHAHDLAERAARFALRQQIGAAVEQAKAKQAAGGN